MGSNEPLVPFRVLQERERHQVSELKTEVAGLKGQVDSLDRKVVQMNGTIDKVNESLQTILDVVARLQTVN